MPEAYISDFTNDTQAILKAAGLDGFHGKQFKANNGILSEEKLIKARKILSLSPEVEIAEAE